VMAVVQLPQIKSARGRRFPPEEEIGSGHGGGGAVGSKDSPRSLLPTGKSPQKQRTSMLLAQCRSARDVSENAVLHGQLQIMNLRDFFDPLGRRRYSHLSLTVAVNKFPLVSGKKPFGTTVEIEKGQEKEKGMVFSARAYNFASLAIERDRDLVTERMKQTLKMLTSADRMKGEDVTKRQAEFLFFEIPQYEGYLPAGVKLGDLLPLDPSTMEETRYRWSEERMNTALGDPNLNTSDWIFNRHDVGELVRYANLWICAARGFNTPTGIDRSTYCRFLLDCGVIGPPQVPYHWALCLFDERARPIRCCPSEASWIATAPVTMVLNRWNLIEALDRIIRQHVDFDEKSAYLTALFARLESRCPDGLIGAQEMRKMRGSWSTLVVGEQADASHEDVGNGPQAGLTSPPQSPRAGRDALYSAVSISDAWRQPPERPAGTIDTGREHRRRLRLVSSMLLEPEVQNLSLQFMPVFSQLFSCYEEDGEMGFERFAQCCGDFCMMPQLVSIHILQAAYASAVCLDVPLVIESSVEQSSSGGSPHKARTIIKRVLLAPRQSILPGRPSANNPRGSGDGGDGDAGSTVGSSDRRPGRDETGSSRSDVSSPGNRRKSDGGLYSRGEIQLQERAEERRERKRSPSPGPEQRFGVAALMETLMKIAFMYLNFYGNNVQASSSSYAKMTWLLTRLRNIVDHLKETRSKRRLQQEAEEEAASAPHAAAALCFTEEKFSQERFPGPLSPRTGAQSHTRRLRLQQKQYDEGQLLNLEAKFSAGGGADELQSRTQRLLKGAAAAPRLLDGGGPQLRHNPPELLGAATEPVEGGTRAAAVEGGAAAVEGGAAAVEGGAFEEGVARYATGSSLGYTPDGSVPHADSCRHRRSRQASSQPAAQARPWYE